MDFIEEVETVRIQESENFKEVKLPLKDWQMQLLQKHDSTCREIAKKLQQDKHMNKLFLLNNGIVYRLWCEDGRTSDCSSPGGVERPTANAGPQLQWT